MKHRLPRLELFNHQNLLELDLGKLQKVGAQALAMVMETPGPEEAALPGLEEIEISFISDHEISAVHAEFLDDPTPTDVITFAHGEILISTETAVRQAAEYLQPPDRETALYLIHGLLHLNGHEDTTSGGFTRMQELQNRILHQLWPPPMQAEL